MKLIQIVKELEKHKINIAKDRDGLRELESEIQTLIGDCDEALDDLSRAIDKLSEQV